jgi:REP element-mobilizing transposase RayT
VRQDFLLNSVDIIGSTPYYRNDWVQRRLLYLADVFAIDLMAFAIMDNHTHLVLHVNIENANQWSNVEILKRWSKLGKLSLLCQFYLNRDLRYKLSEFELSIVLEQIDNYRQKLCDISVFMSRFNYYVARRANKEDKTSGHFWEGRFKSQALLDSQAILSCMLYVDLNPIKAKKSKSIFDSHFTSIKYRVDRAANFSKTKVAPLRITHATVNTPNAISLTLKDYVAHLEALASANNLNHEFIKLDNFTKSMEGWQADTFELDAGFSRYVGGTELVALFKQQARISASFYEKEK